MANPPITIGPFDNVPAPGSPIRSNWPQEISAFVVPLAMLRGGTIVGGQAPAGGIRKIATAYGTPAGRWLVVHVCQYSSTAPLDININMIGCSPSSVRHKTLAASGTDVLTVVAIGTAAGGDISVDLQNTGPQPVDTYADPANHAFFLVGLQAP